MKSNDKTLTEAELIIVEEDLKNTINNGFKVCCPDCHSTDYDIYPTPINPFSSVVTPEEGIMWKCKKCKKVWNSGFLTGLAKRTGKDGKYY